MHKLKCPYCDIPVKIAHNQNWTENFHSSGRNGSLRIYYYMIFCIFKMLFRKSSSGNLTKIDTFTSLFSSKIERLCNFTPLYCVFFRYYKKPLKIMNIIVKFQLYVTLNFSLTTKTETPISNGDVKLTVYVIWNGRTAEYPWI